MCINTGASAPSNNHADFVALALEDRSEFRPLSEILAADPAIATAQFRAAIAMVARQAPDRTVRAAAETALDNPTPATLARLRDLSHRKQWETLLLDGIAGLAIAHIELVLGSSK